MKRVVWIVFSLAVCIFSAHAERRVALVIGNATYADAPLKNPVNDARDMRERLKGLGFVDANIVYRENLKTGEIGDLLREWRAKLTAGGDTVGLVFYAGHGVQIRGENYLPTVDARIEGEDDVPRQAVKLADLIEVMTESRTRLNLVFLDACRSNPYVSKVQGGRLGLASEQFASSTLIIYATRPGAVAGDGAGKNGVFAEKLLLHMNTPNLTVEHLIRKVVQDVKQETSGKQVPWFEGSNGEEFYFSPFRVGGDQEAHRVGKIFKDCDFCPEMVVLPVGSYFRGSPDNEVGRDGDEGPRKMVVINYNLAVSRYEITQEQWRAVMGSNLSRFYLCGNDCPVDQISWSDAQAYLRVLSARTGIKYRLLSESEWEYAARAGTDSAFHTGHGLTPEQANYNGFSMVIGGVLYRQKTMPVGSFGANAFGLFDMHGNVCEWVEDIWHDNYEMAPADGRAWTSGGNDMMRVIRGGGWNDAQKNLRSANRDRASQDSRYFNTGFRVARVFY